MNSSLEDSLRRASSLALRKRSMEEELSELPAVALISISGLSFFGSLYSPIASVALGAFAAGTFALEYVKLRKAYRLLDPQLQSSSQPQFPQDTTS
ncbi:MAG TPA: hypothetical protein VJH37_03415 [Candidatus Nanoarchaeia archaeon]|nr:hypothetical protein [Candidatus Nanoarchaeia archaeon]